jgi:hypothetical protein
MIEPRIVEALEGLLKNPFQKTKDLLPEVTDRIKLYCQPDFDWVVMARKEAKKTASRARGKIKREAEVKILVREQARIKKAIEALSSDEKVPVSTEKVVKADMKQGKSISYSDAGVQALGQDEKYTCLTHNLSLIKNELFKKCKQVFAEVIALVPGEYRRTVTDIIKKKFGYAPAEKVKIIPRTEEKKRYREINIFNDSQLASPFTEELMQPVNKSQAEEKGWSRLSQAGLIDPETGRLRCSFA